MMPQRSKSVTRSASAAAAASRSVSPGDYQKAVLLTLADGPRTLKEIEREVAERVGVFDESPVEAQLDAMGTAGLIERQGATFRLSDDGAELAGFVPEPAAG